MLFIFFFFIDTATTEIYTLSLHDALPISNVGAHRVLLRVLLHRVLRGHCHVVLALLRRHWRSEEHTSELQSHSDLVCRLLLEKKKRTPPDHQHVRVPSRLSREDLKHARRS